MIPNSLSGTVMVCIEKSLLESLDGDELKLLSHLVLISDVNRECSPTNNELKQVMNCGLDKLQRLKESLMRKGAIVFSRSFTSAGQNSNRYKIVTPAAGKYHPAGDITEATGKSMLPDLGGSTVNSALVEVQILQHEISNFPPDPGIMSARFRAIVRGIIENEGWDQFDEAAHYGCHEHAGYITTTFEEKNLQKALSRCSLDHLRRLVSWYFNFRFDEENPEDGCDADIDRLLGDIDFWMTRYEEQRIHDAKELISSFNDTYNARRAKSEKRLSETVLPQNDETAQLAVMAMDFFLDKGGESALKDAFLVFLDQELKAGEVRQLPLNYFFSNDETGQYRHILDCLHIFNNSYVITPK